MVSFLKVLLIGSYRKGFSNRSLKFRGDDVARYCKLSAIVGKARYERALGGVCSLIVAGLCICINIQLGFERKVLVQSMVVLVAFHMFEERIELHGLKCRDDFVSNVPIWL